MCKLLPVIPKQTTALCRRTRGGLLHQLVTWKDQGAPVIMMMKLYVVMIMRMTTLQHHLLYNCHHHHQPPDRGLPTTTTTISIVTTSQSASTVHYALCRMNERTFQSFLEHAMHLKKFQLKSIGVGSVKITVNLT